MKKIRAKNYLIEEPIYCSVCMEEYYEKLRPYKSLSDFMELEAGFTVLGLQVWCKKHKRNVCHIDFEGNSVKTYMDMIHGTTN